jgi:hypothetical protein
MEQNRKLERLGTFCRWMKVASIAIVILLALLVALFGTMACFSFFDANATEGSLDRMSIGEARELTLIGAVSMAVLAAIVYMMYRLFSVIGDNGTPFTESAVKILRSEAILILAQSVLLPLFDYALTAAVNPGGSATMSFNVISLFIAVAVYIIAVIFDYGTELQKESDETL